MIYAFIKQNYKNNNYHCCEDNYNLQKNKILNKYPNAKVVNINTEKDFSELLDNLKNKDIVVVSELDKLGHNLELLVKKGEELYQKNVHIHCLDVGFIEIRNKSKKTDRKLIFREGRPKLYSMEQIDSALNMKNTYSYKQISEITGISKSTLIRAMKKRSKKQSIENEK